MVSYLYFDALAGYSVLYYIALSLSHYQATNCPEAVSNCALAVPFLVRRHRLPRTTHLVLA